jgi:hypothetical protein
MTASSMVVCREVKVMGLLDNDAWFPVYRTVPTVAADELVDDRGKMRLSLNRVTPLGARLVTETGADFDELSYSRFKHGDGVLAERYGSALAAALLRVAP